MTQFEIAWRQGTSQLPRARPLFAFSSLAADSFPQCEGPCLITGAFAFFRLTNKGRIATRKPSASRAPFPGDRSEQLQSIQLVNGARTGIVFERSNR